MTTGCCIFKGSLAKTDTVDNTLFRYGNSGQKNSAKSANPSVVIQYFLDYNRHDLRTDNRKVVHS